MMQALYWPERIATVYWLLTIKQCMYLTLSCCYCWPSWITCPNSGFLLVNFFRLGPTYLPIYSFTYLNWVDIKISKVKLHKSFHGFHSIYWVNVTVRIFTNIHNCHWIHVGFSLFSTFIWLQIVPNIKCKRDINFLHHLQPFCRK